MTQNVVKKPKIDFFFHETYFTLFVEQKNSCFANQIHPATCVTKIYFDLIIFVDKKLSNDY